MSDELDNFIHSLGQPSRGEQVADGAFFLTSLKKLAEVATTEQVATPENQAAGEQAMAEMPAEPDAVDEMAAAAPDPISIATNLITAKAKQQLAYTVFASSIQGPGRDELAELFKTQAADENAGIEYLTRRISVMTNGQAPPVGAVPGPQPTTSQTEALDVIVAGEQQVLILFQALRDALGEDPMRYTIEQMITDTQKHLDHILQQYPEKSGKEKKSSVLAEAVKIAAEKLSAEPKPSADAVVVPPAGSEPMNDTAMREMALALHQAENEKAFLVNRVDQAETAALENAAAAENAQAEAELTAETAEAASAQAENATMQAQEALTAATQAEENAAAQAEGKMRLSMRIQQLRQNLADIVSQDPVAEEALNFGEIAGAGSPVTANQQEAEMAEAEEQALLEAEGASGKAKKEVNQAQRAQNEAAQQTAQAADAVAG